MGLQNSRPLPLAGAELEMAPFFKRRFRTWHLDHVALVVERYRALTLRHCIDAIQLSAILGIKEQPLIDQIMRLFMPKTPTRVHHMVDAMEIVIALILVCQAPSMRHRFEAIFDVIDLNRLGVITPGDVVVVFGAFARTVMKLFCYTVEPNKRAAMIYVQKILESGFANLGSIEKSALCKLMLTDQYAVHYTKQCTGETKHKLYLLLEKDTEFLGAIEFHTEQQMKNASLKTIREMAHAHLYKVPNDFTFLCQGREVKRVWEADRKGWTIVPFAIRGTPGLRVFAESRNRQAECPRRVNTFEFRYMGNVLARYKKRITEVNPVYKHRGFKVASKNNGKPLKSFVRWRVAENWSGEWVYGQSEIAASSKLLVQKALRNAPRPDGERVSVKNCQGQLISPSDKEDDVSIDSDSRPTTVDTSIRNSTIHDPKQIDHRRLLREQRDKKIKLAARMIAMEALQHLDGEEEHVYDKENEPRRANRTTSLDESRGRDPKKRTTVLIQVNDGTQRPSRLFQSCSQANHGSTISKSARESSGRLRVSVLKQNLELQPSSTLSDGSIRLGPFVASSNVILKEDEVEVYPVIVIRPHTHTVEFAAIEEKSSQKAAEPEMIESLHREPLGADAAYLSEYEFEVSAAESNFEHIYHHIHAGSTDLITLNRRDVTGRTLLHDAAEYGHSNLVETLLKERVLRNLGDMRGDTPLHHAARNARLKEVSALLREGAVPWQLNYDGKSALFSALEAAAKNMRQSALCHKRPPQRWNASVADITRDVQEKNFLATNERYSRMRQVIDLLWDRYPVQVLTKPDNCDRASCLSLEQRIYGDMFEACRNGNIIRVQRLIDLDKRATAQYLNEQLDVLNRTALHEATEQGHTAVVDLLLKLGADGYISDQRKQLPLHIASEKGHERIAKCLAYKFPGSLVAPDCIGKTPLHLAAERNHTAIALALIAAIKNHRDSDRIINHQDMYGYTALHYACAAVNSAVCRALIDAGADVRISAYETVVHSGHRHLLGIHHKPVCSKSLWPQPKVRQSAEIGGSVRFELDYPVETLLRSSKTTTRTYHETIELLILLVSSSLSSLSGNIKCTKEYPPPLYHHAVEIASTNISLAVDVCKSLSALKYEINSLHPRTKESALLQECKRVCQRKLNADEDSDSSDLALLRTLVQAGANVDLANASTGETPLACAAWYGHLRLLDFLLEAGAQLDYSPKNSFSPLHFAALGNHLPCSKLLLSRRANINIHMQTPKHDEGPLFFAIRSKNAAMVELFLSQGADPCAISTLQRDVRTAFGIDLAVESGSKRLRSLLKSAIGPGEDLIDHSFVAIASPLTFTLLIACSVYTFSSQAETSTLNRAKKRQDWEALERIAMMIAQRAIESKTPSGSAGSGLITPNDVYLACLLGYWGLAKLLLVQRVMLPNAPTSVRMNALHLAAAAGQSSVVTALIAAGMNVNCRLSVGRSNRGALFFALVHGHVETAARLLVLGAKPLEVLPHLIVNGSIRLMVHESLPRALKTVFFGQSGASRSTESPLCGEYHPERVTSNFVRHLETSINAKVPLTHVAAGMGYTLLVKLLVEAGMSLSSPLPNSDRKSRWWWRREWYADTAIHVAVLCGHLEVVRYCASLVQFNFPRYFSREDGKPKNLLVAACTTKRVDLLVYLLSSGTVDVDGGGYNALDTADDMQAALNCSASVHFVDGFLTLLGANAQPDFFTLATAVEAIISGDKKQSTSVEENEGNPYDEPTPQLVEIFPRETRPHRRHFKRRILARTNELLNAIFPFARNTDEFFKVLSFDHILTTFITCSQYGLWQVFDEVFIANEKFFAEPFNPWKPIVVRAASCCMVLHRAAMADQVSVLRFFVGLGVPSDLRLSELPALPCPIRFAATHKALDAFLFLALRSKNLGESLDLQHSSPPKIQYRSIASSMSWFSPSSTCKWSNLSVMSCYETPRTLLTANFIHAFIHLWISESKAPAGNSLLHLACARGSPVLVQLVVDAGASLEAENDLGETPLMVAAKRKDAFGVTIIRSLLSVLPRRPTEADEATRVVLMSRALVSCFAQNPPCNLKIAKLLLAAGAEANFEDRRSSPPDQSAMRHALESVQFACVKLLLDNGGRFSLSLTEAFLLQFQLAADNLKSQWRRFSSYLKSHGQRLLEAESLMLVLLEKKTAATCLNENLLHQMLIAASAIAATTAKHSGHEDRFWNVCKRILDTYADAISSRKTVWGQKSPLHYAVQSFEVAIVEQLVNICPFDIVAEDELKRTPLHIVAETGDASICHLLLGKLQDKTRIDCANSKGRTPLHLAVIHGHSSVVSQLLQAGASLRARCIQGFNSHLYAAKFNRVAILMALFDKDASRDLFYTSNKEFAVFLAAKNAAFRVVRWMVSVFEGTDAQSDASLFTLTCIQHQRTLLHFASIFGDEGLVRDILDTSAGKGVLNARDSAGYTALLYAYAFGRLPVTERLVQAGADTEAGVDHSNEAKTHPYACRFSISSLGEWFALPGWFTFVTTQMPHHEKRLVTASMYHEEQYLFASGYHRRTFRAPIRAPGNFARHLSAMERNAVVRVTIRSWRFPKASLFEFACEVGDENLVELVTRLRLPGLIRPSSSYAVLRRAFLEAVQWNRPDIVNLLLSPKAGWISGSNIQFSDFLEVAIDRAVSRGLEDMAIQLLSQWNGIKENGRSRADANAFAFQFAQAFQVACIRRLTRVVAYMITRGGEQIVTFHWNDGPSLVYAFAFGHTELASLLLQHGANISTIDTYVAPSFKKWIEYGCPENVQIQWYERSGARLAPQATNQLSMTKFCGPLEEYEDPGDRLNAEMMAQLFVPNSVLDAQDETVEPADKHKKE